MKKEDLSKRIDEIKKQKKEEAVSLIIFNTEMIRELCKRVDKIEKIIKELNKNVEPCSKCQDDNDSTKDDC